ncbi:hypothetical protein [Tsukamurella soli]|uniref:Uncharacterized protein n=1 Tax=Tsukamurella soli TaxID=644556 RepID=A0ABP8JFD7_9ACTN
MNADLELARAVADAVLYEGYLLYPYRGSSTKNRSRWQFGVLGPAGALDAGHGEAPTMSTDILLEDAGESTRLGVYLRFLQIQRRLVERSEGGVFVPTDALTVGSSQWRTWDEAVDHEEWIGEFGRSELLAGVSLDRDFAGGVDAEDVAADDGRIAGRVVRRREPLSARITLSARAIEAAGVLLVTVRAENVTPVTFGPLAALPAPVTFGPLAALPAPVTFGPLAALPAPVTFGPLAALPAPVTSGPLAHDSATAIARSLIATHMLLTAPTSGFVSTTDPPAVVAAAVPTTAHDRCWPVLAGPEGQDDVLLLAPIILYDHPAIAPESSVALFDSTEIDEILTLRVLTLTDDEKAEARRTDPRAAEIIDRCEAMTPEQMQQLHGTLRDPRGGGPSRSGGVDFPSMHTPGVGTDALAPWWDPGVDGSVRPDADSVVIEGVPIAKGSVVTVRPRRRADAQDLFSAGRRARVTGVFFDVDGETHVSVVLLDDPAADLHEWYGRYLYFSPDELVPVTAAQPGRARKEVQQ